MKTTTFFTFFLILFFSFSELSFAQDDADQYWPQWRGPNNTGAAISGNPPIEFGESQNLKWKLTIPGFGHATPIVWEDMIIVQTAAPEGGGDIPASVTTTDEVLEYKVILVNRENGAVIWETTVTKEEPQEGTHELGSWASNSPVTDGEHIYAYFGSRGIYCLDFDGSIIWQKDFGQMEIRSNFGEGSSPYLYEDKIFIQWDHQGDSFIAALDKATGDELWRQDRDEITSWSTPLVIEVNGSPQVITSATGHVTSYDANSGEVIWTSTGMTENVIPNPKYADGILYVMSGFRGTALQAIDVSKAEGDIMGTDAILWQYNRNTPYTPDGVVMNGRVYFMRANNGFLTCVDAKTGEEIYASENIEGISTLYSSPTGVDDRLYIAAENICVVVSAGDTPEILASNELNDNFHASPVIVGNDLILKGFDTLYCFSR